MLIGWEEGWIMGRLDRWMMNTTSRLVSRLVSEC